MDKIKEIISSTWFKITSWTLLAVGVIGLVVAGIVTSDINEVVNQIGIIIALIGGVFAFISERIKKQ